MSVLVFCIVIQNQPAMKSFPVQIVLRYTEENRNKLLCLDPILLQKMSNETFLDSWALFHANNNITFSKCIHVNITDQGTII